jgi:hypothetical protein
MLVSSARMRRRTWGATAVSLDCQESLFVQKLALLDHPDATFIMSQYHAGVGQKTFGRHQKMRADCTVSEPAEGGGAKITVYNYHGIAFHCPGGRHVPSCPSLTQEQREEELARRHNCPPTDTELDDASKVAYARRLSEAASGCGVRLTFEYRSVYECEVFHGDQRASLRKLLAEQYPEQSVLGFGRTRITQAQLVRLIVDSPPNSEGFPVGGFVVLRGGEERGCPDDDFPVESMGFCMQRCAAGEDCVGQFTRSQALALCGGDEEARDSLLRKEFNKTQTMTRRSFRSGAETLGLEYFRWLVLHRGLANFEIRHFLYYRHAPFLTPWLVNMLQKRRELPAGAELESNLLKLILNGFYG